MFSPLVAYVLVVASAVASVIASVDHRRRGLVTLTMAPDEFTELVEWFELLAPDDGCTRHWRDEHDRVMPREDEEG